jgi:hypothetical protein
MEPFDLGRFDAFVGGFSRRDPAEIMVISKIPDRHRNGMSAGGMGGLC